MFNYLHTCNPIGQMHAITSALLNKYQKMQKLLHASAHCKYIHGFICNNINVTCVYTKYLQKRIPWEKF